LSPLLRIARDDNPRIETNENGRLTAKASKILEWSPDSGVEGRRQFSPRADIGIEYDDLRPLAPDASEPERCRRQHLEAINNAECVIALDIGEVNLIMALFSRSGETSDVLAWEKRTTSAKIRTSRQLLELAMRKFGQAKTIGSIFEGEHLPVLLYSVIRSVDATFTPTVAGEPVENPEAFFSNERKDRLDAGSTSSLYAPSSSRQVSSLSTSALPPILLNKIRSHDKSTADERLAREHSRTTQRLQRDWARVINRLSAGARTIGVKIGHFARGKVTGRISAGVATKSVEAFLNALWSINSEAKVIMIDEYGTSSFCPRCGST
jgi:hypothetical protein